MKSKGLKGEWVFVTDGNVVGNLIDFRHRKFYLVTQFLLG